ncbi:MAG: ATP-binding protein [Promethearchaeota archaeon]|nr:MAG: ATP-binding protein [Candidatus Lokiarchaeota archaeon]
MKEEKFIGYIIGEASSSEFEFVTSKDIAPMKWDYLSITASEQYNGREFDTEILAQVSEMYGTSKTATTETLPSIIQKQIEQNVLNVKIYGIAKILGYIDRSTEKKTIRTPRKNRLPGEKVYIASDSLLSEFFSKREEQGLHIGSLLTNDRVKVYLDPNGLNRHLAIIAQTGAGKSYTAGVVIEELYTLGASIVIIDPHSDYVFLSQKEDYSPFNRSEYITVYRNPSSTGRYKKESIPNLKDYEINFGSLDLSEIAQISGIGEGMTRIKEVINRALSKIEEEYFPPKLLIEKLEEMYNEATTIKEKGVIQTALIRIRRILRYKVFGNNDIPIKDIIKPWSLTILDLSGLNDKSMNYIASKILNDAYNYILTEADFPIFIFVEEAHRFIPPYPNSTFCSQIVNTIAAEGRKFGLFLVLITQRPSKIAPDSLSQCNSQIIMKITNPKDQNAILESSERATDDLLKNLPGLSPGEAIITGDIVKVPVMVSIRKRITREGGADIIILDKLRQAREAREIKEDIEKESKMRTNPSKNPFDR